MGNEVYIYIVIMALVTYLIRMLPLWLIRREIQNKFIRSFLYYVPYVTLSAMTFPAILSATGSTLSAVAGLLTAIILAYKNKGLLPVALSACAVVFIIELLPI